MSCDFFRLAALGVQGLQPYQPGKPIEELEREYGVKNAVKLASNENPLGPSPLVVQAVQSVLPELFRYPDGNGFILKQALAKRYNISIDRLTLGNGSNDVLELIARAFLTPAHSVIFSEYAFAVYPIVSQAIGAQMIVTPAKAWRHDLEAMQQAVRDNTRVIFLANPNNPTGTWISRASLRAFLEAIPDDVIVVIDEAYFEYVNHPEYPDGLTLLEDYSNLIVCRTFSKAYGLAGLRVGYAVAHPDITNLINRVRQPFNVNSLGLIAAATALQDSAYLQRAVCLNSAGMQQLTEAFKSMGLAYIESVGNFVTVSVGEAAKIYELLLRQGVIVRPLTPYKMPNHLRVSIGTESENDRFIRALQQVLSHQ